METIVTGLSQRLRKSDKLLLSVDSTLDPVFGEKIQGPERGYNPHYFEDITSIMTIPNLFGLTFVLYERDEMRGRLVLPGFEAQRGEPWRADLHVSENIFLDIDMELVKKLIILIKYNIAKQAIQEIKDRLEEIKDRLDGQIDLFFRIGSL